MRDIVLTLLVIGVLPIIMRRPYVGVLVWSWLSYMNPHRFTWGFAYNMPFAQIVAITLLASLLFTKEKIHIPRGAIVFLMIAFIGWMIVSTAFAIYPVGAWAQMIKVIKIQLVIFLTLMLIDDYKKLEQLIWVIVLSIGFFSVKGGMFTLLTGGAFRVWGPAGSFIEENNSLAVATLMIMPLMLYLRQVHIEKQWLNIGLIAAFVLSAVSVVGSQSRGALVAILAVCGFFWLKSKSKLLSGLVMVLMGLLVLSFMPQSWYDRMNSIKHYEQDESAMGRLNAWEYAINISNDRLTGGGFESWSSMTFATWAPDPTSVHAAHSIFFGVLGDHGWPGLILFTLILFLTWRKLSKILRFTRDKQEYTRQNLLARMLQVSLIAYMSGGAFLSLAYFDLPWHLISIVILLGQFLGTLELESRKPVKSIGKFGHHSQISTEKVD